MTTQDTGTAAFSLQEASANNRTIPHALSDTCDHNTAAVPSFMTKDCLLVLLLLLVLPLVLPLLSTLRFATPSLWVAKCRIT